MPGDVGKEGISYEEQVLTFFLTAPYEHTPGEKLDLLENNVIAWEINPKLFNNELLGVPFFIDIDFYIKKDSTYYIFSAKSSRKLVKETRIKYVYKALATFCTLESRKSRFREEFIYYYISDIIPYDWINTIPTLNNGKLGLELVNSIGCQDENIRSEIFSEENLAKVKYKTRFIELTQQTINERKANPDLNFNSILSKVSERKRSIDHFVQPGVSSLTYDIIFGNKEISRPYSLKTITFLIGNVRNHLVKVALEFERSGKLLEVKDGLIKKGEILYNNEKFSEIEALDTIIDLLNETILPEEDCKSVSMIITANDYRVILFRHKEISDLIKQELNIQEGTYDISKVNLFSGLDFKTIIKISIISFYKGRGIGLPESALKKPSETDDVE